MRGFFNGLVLGIILGAAGFWFIQNKTNEHPEAQQHYEQSMTDATAAASEAASNFSDAMKAKLETLNLQPAQIKDELVKTGQVIRRKAYDIGESAADAASDVRAVTEIKAKYAEDSTLSVWKISVSCNQGHVTLSGTVSSPDDIGKAVALALDAGGVRDVTSTLQVKPSQ
ncbi:MAG TPA: BON domain-containing protein [Candidatus Angelobacter sp.]|jgi:osmotically-inducible protein OsmY|nr:BON domain-containing protein [Candidatus Angelobacter sp.]